MQNKISTYEHEVGTFTNTFLTSYFPVLDGWTGKPEQIQITNERPDYTVQRLINYDMHYRIVS